MDVADYTVEIRREMGAKDDDPVISDEICLWALNNALKTIATDKDWPWLYTEETFNSAANDSQYDLPAGYTRSAFITFDGGGPIEPSTRITHAQDRVTTGVPSSYVIEGTQLRLYPTPRSVAPVVHAYYQAEPALVDPTDEPLLPDAYSNWAVLEAAIEVSIRTNNLSRLQTLRDRAAQVRQGVVDNYRRSNAPGRIRKTRSSTWPPIW